MFITQEDAEKRLKSGDNLLVRLHRTHLGETTDVKQPEVIPDVIDADYDEVSSTISTETDPVRQAVLEARREARPASSRGGRYKGQPNVPVEFRALVGAAARLTTTKTVAKATGLSHLTVHNYKNGKTSSTSEPSQTMLEQIEESTLGIRKQVLGILSYTVAGITPESLENKDPKELSIIARNLSSIMASTKPPADFGDKTTNAQVIVFSPEQEEAATYDTVHVG